MTTKETIIKELDAIPEETLKSIYQFIEFQKYAETLEYLAKKKVDMLVEKMEHGEYVSDDEYFASIPGFNEELEKAASEPLEECADYLEWE